MDTIIVLLVLVLPTIFSLIGKKFEAAAEEGDAEAKPKAETETGGNGNGEMADAMKKLAEIFGLDDPSRTKTNEDRFPMPSSPFDEMDEYEDVEENEQPAYQQPESAHVEMPKPAPVSDVQIHARAAAFRQQMSEQAEAKKRHRETIDPKKLVIYSEIMKPKFLE